VFWSADSPRFCEPRRVSGRAERYARGLTAFGLRMRQATLLNQRSLMTAKRCNQRHVSGRAARNARGLTAFGSRMRQATLLNQRSLMTAKRCNQRHVSGRTARNARGLTAFGSRMRQATLLNQRSLMTAKRCNQRMRDDGSTLCPRPHGLRLTHASGKAAQSTIPHDSKAMQSATRERPDRPLCPRPHGLRLTYHGGSRMRRAKLLEPRADDCWIRTLITLTNHQPATFLALEITCV
jgi:hypothetical protein